MKYIELKIHADYFNINESFAYAVEADNDDDINIFVDNCLDTWEDNFWNQIPESEWPQRNWAYPKEQYEDELAYFYTDVRRSIWGEWQEISLDEYNHFLDIKGKDGEWHVNKLVSTL